eukprot:gene7416-9187_t
MSPTTILHSLRLPSMILAAVVVWAVGLTTSASAAVKLSNLESPSRGGVTIDANFHKAQPFLTTASGPFEITTVTLRMAPGFTAGGGFSVAIYSGASAPSQLVTNGRLVGESNPMAAGNYTYTASGLTLDPDTPYWIVASVTSGAGSYRWDT